MVFADGREIPLTENPILFRYAGTIQEEVHRFAIDYHRSLRSKKAFHSVLDDISGVGPTRRNALLAHFGTLEAIKGASAEALMEVPGITAGVAKNIKEYFG